MKWPVVKIEDIFDVARGGSPRPIDDFITDDPDGVNWIMIGDTKEGGKYIESTGKKIRPEGVSKSRMVHEGDFLLTNSMSFGRPYILKTSGCIHDGWLVLSPKSSEISTDYFYYYLGSQEIKNKLSAKAAGAVVKNLNKDIVKSLEIPLPPLAEQQRIAAILDKADAIRRKRQQAILLADEFLRAVFLEMFGDPVTNPKGWEVVNLGDLILSGPSNGLYKPSSDYGDGTRILRIDGFYSGEVVSEFSLKRVRVSESEKEKFSLNVGDVVINRVNSREYLGKTALIRSLDECVLYESNMMRFSIDTEKVDCEYFITFMQQPFIKRQILSSAKDAVNQSSINQQDVKALNILKPPLDLQKKFGEIVCLRQKAKGRLFSNRELYADMFSSLSQKAFKGEL